MGKVRDYNIEALRCCLMALIVLGHVATGLNVGDANVRRLINATQAFSVDSFILISGWYGVRFSWMKVLKLCGLGLFASFVLFLLSPLTTYPWRFEYSLGWFGNSYLGLLFVATFINAGINGLRNESERALVVAWGLYATLMFVGWFPLFHGVCGGGGG